MIAPAKQTLAKMRSGEGVTLTEYLDGLRAGYEAARPNRFVRKRTGYLRSGSSADYHLRRDADLLQMIEIARDIDRNDGIVGVGVNRFCSYVLQSGFVPDPATGDTKLDAELTARWQEWSEDPDACDLQGEHDFAALTEFALREIVVSGDLLGNPTDSGHLELIEAHRLRSGTWNRQEQIIHGVELDNNRRRVAYWVTRDEVPFNETVRRNQLTQIMARDENGYRNAFYLANPKRISQTRGVTAFAPITGTVSQLDDIAFAKLVQQQTTSCFAILRELPAAVPNPSNRPQQGAQQTENIDQWQRLVEQIAPGMEVQGRPGETIKGFSPNIPNAEYFDHVRLTLTFIAINLELPLIVLLMDASQTNFSGWRGAWLTAQIRFRFWQRLLIRRWHRPVYLWKLRQWAEEDPAMARRAERRSKTNLWRHRWKCPAWDHIQPIEDISADLMQVRNALNSPRRIQAARGRDWEEIAAELIQDNAHVIDLAISAREEIASRYPGIDLDWREVLSLPTPDQVAASWQITPQQNAQPQTTDES